MNTKKPNKNSIGALSWIINVILLSVCPPVGVVLLILHLNDNDLISKLIIHIFNQLGSRPQDVYHQSQNGYQQGQHTYQQNPSAGPVNSSSRSRAARQGYPGGQVQGTGTPQGGTPNAGAPQAGKPYTAAPQYQYQYQGQAARPAQGPAPQVQSPGPAGAPAGAKEQKDTVARVGKGRTLLIIFGWLLLAAGVLAGIQALSAGLLWRALWFAAVALGGGGMLAASWKKGRKEQDYQNCVKVVGDKACIELNTLAAAVGRKPKDLEKDLDDMVDRGYFGDAAYFDKARDVLIIDREKAEAELNKAAAASPEGKDQYQLLLMELDRSVQRIHDPEMLQKALKIRGLTSSIFAAVREEPAKRPKIATFLNYYFPQTLKLLNSYGDIASKDYQGENLSKTRERIEGAADLLIDAYQRQLDALYLSTSMDVDSDIDVLETMLKRDGLSGGDFASHLGEGEGQQLGGT